MPSGVRPGFLRIRFGRSFNMNNAVQVSNEEIYRSILDEFIKINRCPRAYGHMEYISPYLYQWGLDHGFETVRDEAGNVRWDVPATKGYEASPRCILQAHMDLVPVSDDGRDLAVSPVTVVEDTEKGIVSSDGHTSLGADDGIGVAIAMYLSVSDAFPHGPLRVICTVNEEGGSPSGTGGMDPAWVQDGEYMVNIDTEDYGICTVACCGSAGYTFDIPLQSKASDEGKAAYVIELDGLLGGHSGVEIEKNRASAIKAVNYILAYAEYRGIDMEIASFTGGTGYTAIPRKAKAVVVIPESRAELFEKGAEQAIRYFAKQFDRTEKGYTFTCVKTALPERVLTSDCSAKIIGIIAASEDGLHTVSQRYRGVTESSFNMGTLDIASDMERASVTVIMRINSAWPCMLAHMQFRAIAKAFGVTLNPGAAPDAFDPDKIYSGWSGKETDTISAIYSRAFREYTGEDCVVSAVHGGLECAAFAAMNPDLQIIAVGPTIENPHSVTEHVVMKTIPTTCGAIGTFLSYIAAGIRK